MMSVKSKNIHVLPTDKPSRLFYNVGGALLFKNYENHNGVNIYITSDEEIKEDYVIAYGFVIKVMMFEEETLYFVNGTKAKREDCKKIILTTDQDLIKDGVQAIDDEFIEWFIKNPSCESVETVFNNRGVTGVEKILKTFGEYKIIIPSEEAKQETLEEVAERLFPVNTGDESLDYQNKVRKLNWIAGAKWQQEKMYSEEEVKEILTECTSKLTESKLRWFELFKKNKI